MNLLQQPLFFEPVYKDYIWGGQRIASVFNRNATPTPCAESWEISAHPDGMSVVKDGTLGGKSLADLTAQFGRALIGTKAKDTNRFPLLFKIIDACEKLSVQIHPSERTAPIVGGEPKTEMWYMLDAQPGAALYAGLAKGTGAPQIQQALANGALEKLLPQLSVQKGSALFIPGGLVHAIGEGCLIYEVQQSSNTTYRFYDWGRVGADGKPRELHTEKALAAIDWSLPMPKITRGLTVAPNLRNNVWREVLSTPFFNMRHLGLTEKEKIELDGTSFHAVFAIDGEAAITVGDVCKKCVKGVSCLIPATADTHYAVKPTAKNTELLITTL